MDRAGSVREAGRAWLPLLCSHRQTNKGAREPDEAIVITALDADEKLIDTP